MKEKKNNIIFIIIIILFSLSFIILKINQLKNPPLQQKENLVKTKVKLNQESLDNIKKLVKIYITNNINSLSPEQPVLGGKFLITKITFLDNDKIKIAYTDGHNEYVARAQYLISPHQPLTIDNFTLLMKNKELLQTTKTISADDLSLVAIKEKLAKVFNQPLKSIDLSNITKIANFWRGEISIKSTDLNAPFWAILNNGEYQVFSKLEKTDSTLCKKLLKYNFPSDLILECL